MSLGERASIVYCHVKNWINRQYSKYKNRIKIYFKILKVKRNKNVDTAHCQTKDMH